MNNVVRYHRNHTANFAITKFSLDVGALRIFLNVFSWYSLWTMAVIIKPLIIGNMSVFNMDTVINQSIYSPRCGSRYRLFRIRSSGTRETIIVPIHAALFSITS